MLTDGCWSEGARQQLRWLSGGSTAGVPRRTGRRFRWVIEWPQGCPHRCTRTAVQSEGAAGGCGSPRGAGTGICAAHGRKIVPASGFAVHASEACRGSFSAFCRKVPHCMLAAARNEATLVWMQESYLSLPVFSSRPPTGDEKARRRFCIAKFYLVPLTLIFPFS